MRRTRLTLAAVLAVSAVVVGLPAAASAAPSAATPKADIPVQLLAMNDFHGRISETTGGDSVLVTGEGSGLDGADGTADDGTVLVGGAANVASTVKGAREAFTGAGGSPGSSFFVGAGDLISASPFNSSAFKDEPTIEVLDAMGLDVSSVGNHEFDRGTQELRRISAVTDAYEAAHGAAVTACQGVVPNDTGCYTDSTGQPFDGADFPYLAANVVSKTTHEPMLPPYQVFDVAGGKKIALIGVVTETTPTIVSPAGIQDVDFIDEAEAVNRYVPELQAQGIQAIGVLVHEGGTHDGADAGDRNGCDTLTGPVVDINNAVVPAVDLIISAHSHQAYNCLLTDPAGQPRLVTQAGFYGRLVSDIRLTLDGTTGDVERFCAAYSAVNVPVARNNPDPAVAAIVKYWNDKSAVEGNRVVGSAEADIRRAGTFRSDGSFEAVRTAESGLGNLVAQAQLEAVQDPAYGSPVIAFMNPGGLRTDILQGEVTYSELFDVQPFGNTVNVITLTGADIRAVLEQQFQAGGPRGDTLILGTSEGFSYQYDTSNAYGQRIDPGTIRLNGTTIHPAGTYRVVANSFLITGGDSFKAFTNGTGPAIGPLDVDTAVLHFQRHSPVRPPATGHGVAAAFATDPAPATGLGGTASEPAPVTTVDASTGLNGTVCDATATIADDTPMRGDRATVAGLLFAPGEQVTATLDEGAVLGGATADPSGAVSIDYRVPVSLGAGQYTATLTGASGEHASDTFTLDPLWVELIKRLAALFHQ